MNYKEIKTEKDIEKLMETYGNFHDSCIISISYETGNIVDEDLCMGFGDGERHRLKLVMRRQWRPANIELLFVGVREFHVTGYMEDCSYNLIGADVYFAENLFKGKKVIVWTDGGEIETGEDFSAQTNDEGGDGTYIIADKLFVHISD